MRIVSEGGEKLLEFGLRLGENHDVCVEVKKVGSLSVANANVAQNVDWKMGVEKGCRCRHQRENRHSIRAERSVLV